jgi:hypothetical protein
MEKPDKRRNNFSQQFLPRTSAQTNEEPELKERKKDRSQPIEIDKQREPR